MKFKLFFTFLLLIGAVIFGLNKPDLSKKDHMLTKDKDSSLMNHYVSSNKINPFSQREDTISNENNSTSLETTHSNNIMQEKEKSNLSENNSVNRDSLEYVRSAMVEGQDGMTQLSRAERRYIQNKRNHNIATINTMEMDNEIPRNRTIISNREYSAQYDTPQDDHTEEAINADDVIEKEPNEPNAKTSNSAHIFPGYITGSAINNNIENNGTNTSRSRAGILVQNSTVVDNNRSIFPSKSREALHYCYFDNNAKMQCKKSIITCEENGELGLKCTISYYLNDIWYRDPTQLTTQSNVALIQKHLETKTTFALPKFTQAYDEEKYSNSSLIRADLNASKKIKLKQTNQYVPVKTRLDRGIVKLSEINNTRTATSVLVRGTRFGTGHEKVQGANSELLQALRDYLSQFSTSDDSDIYGVLDYWTLMDDSHKFGDCEDFALTAMEWLLRNGIDPKYLTLTEVKKYGVDTTHIILVIQTEEPVQQWIVNDLDVVEIENLYPNGYESLLLNSYQYVD